MLCEASIGDSDIQRCNDRLWVNHQVIVAEKMWRFAKDNLGVIGVEEDNVYIEALKAMESRDQDTKIQRETNNAAQ